MLCRVSVRPQAFDRDLDRQVARTRSRPLASGAVSLKSAWIWLVALCLIGLLVLLQLNPFAAAIALAKAERERDEAIKKGAGLSVSWHARALATEHELAGLREAVSDLLACDGGDGSGYDAGRYAEVRERTANRSARTERLSYAAAIAAKPQFDWAGYQPPVPTFTGVKVLEDIDLNVLAEYIDWTPFFVSWNLAGKYPRILSDEVVGEAATSLFNDAQDILRKLIDGKLIKSRAVFGFWPANQVNHDDLEVYAEDGHKLATLHHLRQQTIKPDGKPNFSLADFVAPKDSGIKDYVGGFITTAGIGAEEVAKAYEAQGDDYNAIMVKALADRLAEACAEWLHERVRKEYWGYQPEEHLDNDALIREQYVGIRPAPGYPACPDHTEKGTLFQLLDPKGLSGVTLTEHYAMFPAAAVSGWYFAHPQAQYFAVGKVDKDQIDAYSARKGQDVAVSERWLSPNLGYDA